MLSVMSSAPACTDDPVPSSFQRSRWHASFTDVYLPISIFGRTPSADVEVEVVEWEILESMRKSHRATTRVSASRMGYLSRSLHLFDASFHNNTKPIMSDNIRPQRACSFSLLSSPLCFLCHSSQRHHGTTSPHRAPDRRTSGH